MNHVTFNHVELLTQTRLGQLISRGFGWLTNYTYFYSRTNTNSQLQRNNNTYDIKEYMIIERKTIQVN